MDFRSNPPQQPVYVPVLPRFRSRWLAALQLVCTAFWVLHPLPIVNSYQHDSNGDGVPEEHANPTDPNDSWWSLDSDGDQLTNAEEVVFGSDPYSIDSDLDGLTDRDERDLSMTHPWQWDSDSDGYSDHDEFYSCYTVNYNDLISQAVSFTSYFDADGDGAHNHQDSHPLDNLWWNDWNGNGTPDDQEWTPPDSDGDGQIDPNDSHPNDSSLWSDWNYNGVNDENDPPPDWDGDGVANPWDSHPNDPSLWNDWNNNGYNDENDPPLDSDGDGEPDSTDPAPYDPNIDSNTPPDRDGDGSPDSSDTDPDDSGLWCDYNRNGVNDDVEPDSDGDGIIDGSDPYPEDSENNFDLDGDGLSNYEERFQGTNQGMVDTDQDGLTDFEEVVTYRPLHPNLRPTNPRSLNSNYLDYQVVDATDSDNDGIPNRIEQWYANLGELMNPSNPADAGGDLDGDGYSNLQAYLNGWNLTANRQQYDFDGDRITDAQEDYWNGLHPGSLDKTLFADAVADFDQDGLFNYEELQLGTDLADAHSLHPLLTDGQIQAWQRGIAIPGRYGYDPVDPAVPLPAPAAHSTWDDLDNDGIPDGFANFSATISGGIPARAVDAVDEDQDGMSNVFEHVHHLNPRDATDAGLATGLILHPPAYADAAGHQLALRQDPDEDGLSNRREAQMRTHPRHPDTDGDGHADGTESEAGSNPTQPGSTPPPGSTGPGSGPGSGSTNPGPFANPGLKPYYQPSPSTSVQDGYKIGLVERQRKVTPEVFHHGGMTADPETGEGWEPAVTEVRVYLQPSEGSSVEAEQLAHWVGGGWAGWSEEEKTQFNQDVDTAYASVNGAALPDWGQLPQEELLAGGGVISWAGLLEGIEMHKAEYRLERRSIPGQPAPVDAEGNPIKPEVRRTFLKVKEILAPPLTGGPPQPTKSVEGTVEFIIPEGQDVSINTELLPAPNFKAGEVGMGLMPFGLAIDSDNNNGFDLPDGTSAERDANGVQGDDEKPGKVILVNDGDVDKDGFPDYADGYDLDEDLDQDNESEGLNFVPIVIQLPLLDRSIAKIKFQYEESDPANIEASSDNPFVLSSNGKLRLWKKNGNEARKKEHLKEEGDFIKSGIEYDVQDIGVGESQSEAVLYLEAVRESTETADLEIRMSFYPNGSTGLDEITESVRVTVTRMEIHGRNYGNESFAKVDRVNITELSLNSEDEEYFPPFTPNSYITNQIHIFDPRETGLNVVTIDGQSIALSRSGAKYQSEEFICIAAGEQADITTAPSKRIEISPGTVKIEYNPFGWLSSSPKPTPPPKGFAEVAKLVKEAIDDMKSMWSGNNNPGAFGTEVHDRVGAQLQNKQGWLVNVTVDDATNEIRAIGWNLPPGQNSGTTQIDILHVDRSYRPNVGEILDQNKIIDLYDIKTSVGGKISQVQREALKAVVGGRDIVIVKAEWRWTNAQGWIKNKGFGAGIRILGVVGLASSAYAWVNYSSYDDELDVIRGLAQTARDEHDDIQKKLYAIQVSDKIKNYLGRFMAGSTIVDIVHLLNIYQIIGDDSFERDD